MKAVLAAMLALATSSACAEDMQRYLDDTQQMVRQGNYEEALKRFVWFHEHALEHDQSMTGVRLSFALSNWNALGDVYPPAKTALVEMRDRSTKQIIDGPADFSLFHDVFAINRTLKEDAKTVDLFQTLDQTNPKLAKTCWLVAKDPVINAKRYDLVRKYLGDPVTAFTRMRAQYELSTIDATAISPQRSHQAVAGQALC